MNKIAIITNSIFTFGGEQRVVCIIANELAKKFDLTIFTTDDKNNHENLYSLSTKIKVEYFKPFSCNYFVKALRFLTRFPLLKKIKNFQFIQKLFYYNKNTATRLKNILESKDFDLIIAVSGELTMLLGLSLQYGLNCKSIGWEHNSFEAYFRTKGLLFYKMDKLWINCTKTIHRFILLNEDYVEKYKTTFNSNCSYIYNPRSFVSKEKSSQEEKNFVACCRFVKGKGIDLLLDSFLTFSKQDKNWKLLLVGDGPLLQEYKSFVKKHKLEKRVLFLGKRNDIKDILLKSSVYVLSSRWEGFPMSLTEAYEVGLPAIFYDIPATIPFNKNHEAICCKRYDTSDFANSMLKLAENKELRKQLANNAIKFADSISIENIRDRWFFEINALLNS